MRHAQHHLSDDLNAPARSRRLVEGWTRNHPRRHEIVLAVSELVANAVTHGSRHSPGAGVTLSIAKDETCLRVGVAQRGPPFAPELAGPISEPRGLTIVDRGVDRWGIDEHDDIVEVWFEVDDDPATRLLR